MTAPRYVRAGQTTMAQTRTYRGEYRFIPSMEVNEILEYALARAAQLTGIQLHEFGIMLNHDHILTTDVNANRPEFFRQFHSLVSRGLNCLFKERDQTYSQRRYTDPVLLDGECVLEKCAYVLSNPVKHGYVRYARDWGGVSSLKMKYGVPRFVQRPAVFFSSDMPESIALMIVRPPMARPDLSDEELRTELLRRASVRESDLRAKRKVAGQAFVGMQRIRRLSRRSAPNYGPLPAGGRAAIRPKVAGGTQAMRVAFIDATKAFVAAHRQARLRLKAGALSIVFPAGTYKMRRLGLHAHPP